MTAFQRHQPGAPWQILQLRRGQASPRPLQEAPGEHLVQRNVKIDFRQVLLVLHAVVRAKADGVAEVVDGETRHGGVQIDDADALMGVPVDQDVIQLRVIVGDPKRKLSLPQRPQSNAAVRFPPQNELNLRGYPLCPVQLIGFQRGRETARSGFRCRGNGEWSHGASGRDNPGACTGTARTPVPTPQTAPA